MPSDDLHREKGYCANYYGVGSTWIMKPVFIEIGGHGRDCGRCEYCEHEAVPLIDPIDAYCKLFERKLKVEHMHVGAGFTCIVRCRLCVVGGLLAAYVKNTYGTDTLRALLASDDLYKDLPADSRKPDQEKPRPLDL